MIRDTAVQGAGDASSASDYETIATCLRRSKQTQHGVTYSDNERKEAVMSELPEPHMVKVNHVGILQSARPATPAEIAAAHPKCETCGWWNAPSLPFADTGICTHPDGIGSGIEDLYTIRGEYCSHHSELTGESDE